MALYYMPLLASEGNVSKIFTIDEQEYVWELWYNATHDFYTLYAKDLEGNVLYTTKVVMENDILHAAVPADLAITSSIEARDYSGADNTKVDSSNLGDPVRIYIIPAE